MIRPSLQRIADLLLAGERALPLGVKFVAPLIAVVVLVAGGVIWIEYHLEKEEANDRYAEEIEILARGLALDLRVEGQADPLADAASLKRHIEKVLSVNPAALRVSIYAPGPAGAVRAASSEPSLVGLPAGARDALPLYTGATAAKEIRLGDEKALEVLAPVQMDGNTVASLGVYISLAERDAALRALALRLAGAAALAVLVFAGSISITLRILVVRRLRAMTEAGDALGQGDTTSRVAGRWENPGRDEIAKAVHRFNRMAESIQALTMKLEHLGVTDALTGVYNRRFFDDILPREVSRSQRLDTAMALLLLDLDHFKRVNDRHGHQAGDEALRRVALTLATHLRAIDFVARYGGEEFAVILPGADGHSALETAERLRAAVQSAAIGGGLTVSAGVAAFPECAVGGSGLVAAADAALYAAKDAGRNTVRAAPAVDAAVVAHRR